jgi:hypothetical protein
MLVGVMLAGFFSVMNGMNIMAVCDVGVVTGFFGIAGVVVLGSRMMMFRRVIMVLGGFAMMFRAFF